MDLYNCSFGSGFFFPNVVPRLCSKKVCRSNPHPVVVLKMLHGKQKEMVVPSLRWSLSLTKGFGAKIVPHGLQT